MGSRLKQKSEAKAEFRKARTKIRAEKAEQTVRLLKKCKMPKYNRQLFNILFYLTNFDSPSIVEVGKS